MADLSKKTDIVIGMVTADGMHMPSDIARKIATGMTTYFPQYSWVLVHASSGQTVKQPGIQAGFVRNLVSIRAAQFGVHHVTYPWHGVPAKTSGYRAILEIALRRRASACLFVDPLQQGFDSTWTDSLIRPGLHSRYDLVTPIYSGCAREQILSGHLLSPLLRTLFGIGPRQPMSGELLISARLADRLLARHDWESAPARYIPEFWISFIAAAEYFRMAESYVGPSIRPPRRLGLAFPLALEQITGSLFTLMDQYENRWASSAMDVAMDRFGRAGAGVRESTRQDGLGYLVRFVDTFSTLRDLWRSVLDPHTFGEIEAFHGALRDGETNRVLRDVVWVRIVYEIAAAWKRRTLPRSQILGLFPALFLAQAGSFLMSTQCKEQPRIEDDLARLTRRFQVLHGALSGLWNGKVLEEVGAAGKAQNGVEAA